MNAGAQIVVSAGTLIPCRVSDFSPKGALIAVAANFGLPETFDLRCGATYRASVMRRAPGQLAVQFF